MAVLRDVLIAVSVLFFATLGLTCLLIGAWQIVTGEQVEWVLRGTRCKWTRPRFLAYSAGWLLEGMGTLLLYVPALLKMPVWTWPIPLAMLALGIVLVFVTVARAVQAARQAANGPEAS